MSKQSLILKGNYNVPKTETEKEEIINKAAEKYGEFLTALGFDYKNDLHMSGTPLRVSKSMVRDLICGCYNDPPNITAFDNTNNGQDEESNSFYEPYSGLVYSGLIPVTSLCSHHFLSFTGEAHVCYIPADKGKVVGYSKLGRVVDWFSRRPQVQENLTNQIFSYLNKVCVKNQGIAVYLACKHQCACSRGVKQNSIMMTSKLSGSFLDPKDQSRFEFYKFIEMAKKS
jgi:GTP cyclohydrolase I